MKNTFVKFVTAILMVSVIVLSGSSGYISAGELPVESKPEIVLTCDEPIRFDGSSKLELETIDIEYQPILSKDEIELLALVTMAEAEAEPEEGQRLVIDTILNRVDSLYFPDTVYDVVYQKNQFTSMWNGRTNRCHIRDDLVKLVEEELLSRTNSEVIFFRTGHYSEYGDPMFLVGHHYFSRY